MRNALIYLPISATAVDIVITTLIPNLCATDVYRKQFLLLSPFLLLEVNLGFSNKDSQLGLQ